MVDFFNIKEHLENISWEKLATQFPRQDPATIYHGSVIAKRQTWTFRIWDILKRDILPNDNFILGSAHDSPVFFTIPGPFSSKHKLEIFFFFKQA